jgi:hypothetical protein
MPLADEPRFTVQIEARGSIAVAAIIPNRFSEAPLYGYRGSASGEPVRFPGLPSKSGISIGSAGPLGIAELADALERAAVALRAAISRAQGQTP